MAGDAAEGAAVISQEALGRARRLCLHCALGAPHHTVGFEGIGDGRRQTVYDIHEVEDSGGVGLAECTAYDDVWRAVEAGL